MLALEFILCNVLNKGEKSPTELTLTHSHEVNSVAIVTVNSVTTSCSHRGLYVRVGDLCFIMWSF